jgi:hypothetical protein
MLLSDSSYPLVHLVPHHNLHLLLKDALARRVDMLARFHVGGGPGGHPLCVGDGERAGHG